MASSSSSPPPPPPPPPPAEDEGKNYPYQMDVAPGPRGAYEVKNIEGGGLYVRVDMPGVPATGVKVVKYRKNNRVTFFGKAPKCWVYDSSPERSYGGYVSLDRDPFTVDIVITTKNGVLRMFFPAAHGSLHSLHSINNNNVRDSRAETSAPMIYMPCAQVNFSEGLLRDPNVVIGSVKNVRYHPVGCSCCQSAEKAYITFHQNPNVRHINPYLLQGVEGVCGTKLEENSNGPFLYMRTDMPGLGEKEHFATVRSDNVLFYGGEGQRECNLDEGGRTYHGCLKLRCSCCKITNVHDEMKDGVLRILFTKQNIKGLH